MPSAERIPPNPTATASNAGNRRGLSVIRSVRPPFTDVPGPFYRPTRATDLDDHATPQQERAMRSFWWDGFWASSSESVLISYLSLYLLAFGASNSQVGMLSSLSSLFAAIAFLPGARLVELIGHRKATVVASGGVLARLPIVALAVVPFVAGGNAAIWLVIGIASFRGFFAYFHVPAWTSLTSDIVPLRMRGRYLASRNFGMSVAALAMAPLAGFLVDRFTGLHGWQLVWLVSFVAGALSTWCYARIPEPPEHPRLVEQPTEGEGERSQGGFFADILRDRNFVSYLVSIAVWNIALMAAGPFFNVYLVKNLHASTFTVGALSSLPALTGLGGLLFMGRVMDRRGTKWLMVSSALLIPVLPVGWMFVTAAWQVIFINAASGLLWAGYNLSLANMVMVMSTPEKRARYAAAFQTVTMAACFVGPILGGYLIDAMGFHAVFAFSAVGRMAAALILLRYVTARPHGEREEARGLTTVPA
jgi:MFS family permease